MKNWSVDEKFLQKYPKKHNIWKLEQLINFGLDKEKLSLDEVKKNISKLNIDPAKKRFLKFIIK